MQFSLDISQRIAAKLKKISDARVREAMAEAINESLVLGVELIKSSIPIPAVIPGVNDLKQDHLMEDVKGSIEVLKFASADDLRGAIGSQDIRALYVEYGTGIYHDGPGGPHTPFVVKAKNPRTITYTRNGRTFTRTVVLLTFMTPNGWRSKKEVTIKGMRPLAPFRKNMSKLEYRFKKAARDAFNRLV